MQSDINPVFIGGSPSTGSTLLRTMLNNHPSIYSGPELSVFNKRRFLDKFEVSGNRFKKWLSRGLRTNGYSFYYKFFHHLDAYDITQEQLIKWSEEAGSARQLMDKFMGYCLKSRQEFIFVEKTPSNAFNFGKLMQIYPEAKCIHLFRDGRDVICSLRKRRFSYFQASSSWLYNTAAAMRFRGHPGYLELSYRELVTEPEKSMRKICAFLEVEFDRGMLKSEKDSFQASKMIKQAWSATPGGEVKQVSVNRYKKDLTKLGEVIFNHTRLTSTGARWLGCEIRGAREVMKKLGFEVPSISSSRLNETRAYGQQIQDRVYRRLKSIKHLERPYPALTKLDFQIST